MDNQLITQYGAVVEKEIRIDIDVSTFIEKKRHWWHRSHIIQWDWTHPMLKEFDEHMKKGGYTSYIQEVKEGLFNKSVWYKLVITKK